MPNWESASDYAFTAKLDAIGWTWEFLRRNAQYREDFAKVKATQELHKGEALDSDSKDPHESGDLPNGWTLGAKWWIKGPIRDPARNEPPIFITDFPWQPNLQQVKSFFRVDADATAWEDIEDNVAPHEIPEIQRLEFATLVFDLRKPLPEQIKRGRESLSKRQAYLKKEIKKPPPHKGWENWRLYIRLLDAREGKATYAEIAETIFKDQLGGKEGYDPTKKIEKQLMRARALQEDALSLLGWSHPIQSG